LDADMEEKIGDLLLPYFDDDNTIFCISSDFCRWGKRYKFTYFNEKDIDIFKSIEKLD
jgi:predicted class III extradiol MEMO1 family dioxygenase